MALLQLEVKSHVEAWKTLPWKKFQKVVFRLQHRIYRFQQANEWSSVRKLQRLLFNSRAAKFLAIRQVTQLNTGKVTAGIDGVSKLNPKERFNMFEELKNLNKYKHQPLKRIYIPKSNGEKRPLGIPTIKDRIVQCLVKYTLEPVYEAYASRGSWGFRSGRSTWDVLMNIFINLKTKSTNYKKRILELDIEKCFDKINHEKLLELISLPKQIQKIVRSSLKAGVLKERLVTDTGTPQGGIISPLLCNIALHGIEDLLNQPFQSVNKKTNKIQINKSQISQRGLRYADDIILFLEENDDANKLLDKINDFLYERGLKIKESKTHLVKSTEGFDFLGWRFKVKTSKKLTCFPSKKNRIQIIQKIKTTMRNNLFKMEERLNKVNVIYKGWCNYHQYSDLSQVNLWSISDWVYKFVKKANNKIKKKEERKKAKARRLDIIHNIFNGNKYSLFGHVAVKSNKSPFDNDWIYWGNRKHLQYWGTPAKILKSQRFKCGDCKLKFGIEDRIEIHHIDGNHENNLRKNLIALHRSCHQYQSIHKLKKESSGSSLNLRAV